MKQTKTWKNVWLWSQRESANWTIADHLTLFCLSCIILLIAKKKHNESAILRNVKHKKTEIIM